MHPAIYIAIITSTAISAYKIKSICSDVARKKLLPRQSLYVDQIEGLLLTQLIHKYFSSMGGTAFAGWPSGWIDETVSEDSECFLHVISNAPA